MLFYLAALQAIPVEVYEAAAIDGARTWRAFWKITFPLLRPAHFFVLVVAGSERCRSSTRHSSSSGAGADRTTRH